MSLIIDIGASNLKQSSNKLIVVEYTNFILNLFTHVDKYKIVTEKDDQISWINSLYYIKNISITDITDVEFWVVKYSIDVDTFFLFN